jgi:hypothetical protein
MEDRVEDQGHARAAAWAVLAGAGSTMVTFNTWHALHSTNLAWLLAWFYGLAPASLAMGVSHIVAVHRCGKFMKTVAFLVMTGAMAMSVGATAAVIGPAAGPVLRWLFGAVTDTAALVAFRVILSPAPAPAPVPVPEPLPAPAPVPPPRRSPRAAPRRSGSGRRSAPADDLTLEARALELLAADLAMSGASLGRALGVSEGYGRKLRHRLVRQHDGNSNAGSKT